ncbi:lisH domain-containing protein C1711.05 isoform X1 [Sinocyclocheilus rhinocerous]|uniref:lisH domain-containing protein C1711.05 isoform X1 n=1 Tax=Sinocyclocheilus rhinocerous TaxID=307959 RepID=UPI0007BA5AED|nr:PREDICTED: lisH domain-containing protein C1711.05-like isoform X1 [Sinocyclocheilus rhinocerous]
MTSNITDASQDELINLIYHHLKDNGYKKAANVLRKHAPQVETEEVKASLSEIFKKWASLDDGDIPPVPSGVQTPELQSPAKSKTGSSTGTKSKVTAPSAVDCPENSMSNKKASGLAKKSTKKKDSVPPLVLAAPGNNSDSDSSLDVEKWRKMLSELSDADRAKMEVLSILDETPVSSPAKSSAKGKMTKKPARAKNEGNPAKKAKSNTPAKAASAKPDDIPVTTDASETPSKKSKHKDATAISDHEIKTPSKKAGNKTNSSISGLDVVKTPKRTKGKTTNSSVQDETDKPEAHHETNGLLETDKMATPLTRTKEVGVSDSQANRTPKRVQFRADHSFSEQVETPKIANVWKDNGTSETSSTETPSKKAKKRKGQSEASNVETDNSPLNNKEVKEAACKLLETNLTMDATSDQSETQSKKVKSKKSKSVVGPVPDETPSKKVKVKKTEGASEIDQETTSEKADVSLESVKPDSSSKKAKLKDNKSHSETLEPEMPSKKAKAKKVKSNEEPAGEVEMTIKKLKTVMSDDDLLQSDSTNSFSKKRKNKAADVVEIQNDVPSETPLKSSKSQAKTLDGDGLGNEETSSQDLNTPSKKEKRKREEACDVPAPEEATPEPKKAKKDKEKKKSKEGENEDSLQPPAAEEAFVPVETNQKKKKKKKEKEREEETEEIIPDDPPVSAPVEEVVVHKKKKKSSKEKQFSSDEAHGLNST